MGCKLEDVLQAYEIYDKVIHGALGDANLIYKSATKMNGFTKTLNHEGWEYKDLLVFFLHTRGWSSSQSFLDPYASAFPAYAGVILAALLNFLSKKSKIFLKIRSFLQHIDIVKIPNQYDKSRL